MKNYCVKWWNVSKESKFMILGQEQIGHQLTFKNKKFKTLKEAELFKFILESTQNVENVEIYQN